MSYSVEVIPHFEKEFKKLDRYTQRMLKAWIDKNLSGCEAQRLHGKGLTANRERRAAIQNRRLSADLFY